MAYVEVADLTYTPPDGRRALDGISFRVDAGAVAGLTGPSAETTALLRLIAGDLTPASGKIVSDGGIGFLPRSDAVTAAGRGRLALQSLLDGPDQVLLLDELDEHLDVPDKEWLEDRLRSSAKTILLVSRDRQLLANAATQIVSLEEHAIWVHHGSYVTFADARPHGIVVAPSAAERPADRRSCAHRPAHRRAASGREQDSLVRNVRQTLRADLTRARRGSARAITCRRLRFTGLTSALDLEIRWGDRIAVCGANARTKALFLSTLADSARPRPTGRPTGGTVRLHDRIAAALLPQAQPPSDRQVAELMTRDLRFGYDQAMDILTRHRLAWTWNLRHGELSTGVRAGLGVLMLELAEVNLLLLDEPTGHLDPAGADVFQRCLRGFTGVTVAITHDRWLIGDFTRFLDFTSDGRAVEVPDPVW